MSNIYRREIYNTANCNFIKAAKGFDGKFPDIKYKIGSLALLWLHDTLLEKIESVIANRDQYPSYDKIIAVLTTLLEGFEKGIVDLYPDWYKDVKIDFEASKLNPSSINNSINWSILENQINESFAEIVDQFTEEQIDQIKSDKWEWPRETIRHNGQTVGSPRDIIDTGELINSLEVEDISNTEVVYHYPVKYAINVHEGIVLASGVELPARPWVDDAVEELKNKIF
jgi:hypothetical protein